MAWLSIALVIIEGENLAVAGYIFDSFITLGNYNLVKPIVYLLHLNYLFLHFLELLVYLLNRGWVC